MNSIASRSPVLHKWRPYRPVTKTRVPPWLIYLALIVYGGLFVLTLDNPGNSVKTDSRTYIKLAENLHHYHVFSLSESPPYKPDTYRLPLYPLFLALTHSFSMSSIMTAIAIQCVLGILLCFLVWPAFYRQGGKRGATLGVLFLCFDLMTVLHQNLIMTEAIYLFVFTAALCFSILYLENPTFQRAAVAGLTFGIAALIKPIAIIPAALFFAASYQNWKKALCLGLFIFCLPGGWVVRNWVTTGHPVYTIQGNFTLLQYPAASAVAIDMGRTRSDVLNEFEAKLRSEESGDNSDPIILSRAYKRMALRIIAQHPLGTFKYCLSGLIRILGGTGLEMLLDQLPLPPSSWVRPPGSELVVTGSGTRALLRKYPALIPVQLAYAVFLLGGYVLFGKGIWELVGRDELRLAAFMVLSLAVILLISTWPGGTYRLRLLILPFLAFGIAASSTATAPHQTISKKRVKK